MAQIVNHSPQMMILPAANPAAKDSRWLTLEVCREFQRSKCSRPDTECKFAHPPPHVEVQNGRVVACFDSIKGKCQRKDPPCKYLHPPQHLREQLLQNGRNNLILKNLQLQAYQQAQITGVLPMAGSKTLAVPTMVPGQYSYLTPYQTLPTLSHVQGPGAPTAGYNPYIATSLATQLPTSPAEQTSVMSPQPLPPGTTMIPTSAKAVRADKFETTSQSSDQVVTSHAPSLDTFSFPTYIHQAAPSAPGLPPPPHHMVLAKKRTRDPSDELLLQSAMPGMVPAYKRFAMGDISKGGFPVYQTNPLMSPLQHTSLMQLQQPQSYIPMSFAGHAPSVPRF